MGVKNRLFIFVLLIFVGSHCFADHSNVLTLEVAAPRPMAEAVIALGEQLKCPVTYEDIPFEYSGDLRSVFPGSKTRVPSGGRLSLSYEKSSDRLKTIKQLLTQHNMAGNAGDFAVTQTNGIYNVIPIQYKSKTGKLMDHRSVLDKRISISLQKNSNCFDAIKAICAAVTKANTRFRVVVGLLPAGLEHMPFSHDIVNTSAREIINQILASYNEKLKGTGALLTWQLRFSPPIAEAEKPFYSFGFRRMRLQSSDCMKMRVISERPMATAVQLLEKRFGVFITYEDPPYICPCDVLGKLGLGDKSLRGGIININWDVEKDSAQEVLRILVETPIEPRDIKPIFTMEKGSIDNYHVYPVLSKDEQSNFVPRMSIMNKQVSFNEQNIDAITFVKAICSKLSHLTNEDVVLGLVPNKLSKKLKNHAFPSISISNRKGRDCLEQFLGKINGNISWQLLFDPTSKQYQLNLYSILE